LFLADRIILADQAYNAFSPFDMAAPGSLVRIAPDEIRKKGGVPKNGSIFFTIFQTFMSEPPRDGHPSPYFGDCPPDFFDFIVSEVAEDHHPSSLTYRFTARDLVIAGEFKLGPGCTGRG
jgi:type I site-specific restriction endonuclease